VLRTKNLGITLALDTTSVKDGTFFNSVQGDSSHTYLGVGLLHLKAKYGNLEPSSIFPIEKVQRLVVEQKGKF